MAMELYQIVFGGEVAGGWEVDTVKYNLSRLFKADPKVIDMLLDGHPVVIKQGLGRDAATKYIAAPASAGGVGRAQPMPAGNSGVQEDNRVELK